MKLSIHAERIISQLAKKRRLKSEECLMKILLSEYKEEFKKDYLLS